MENKNSVWLNITGVISYFMGVVCISSLVLIPLGIYCFMAGARYFNWATLSDTELYNYKNSLRNWGIFVSIIGFPIGLISLIPFIKMGNNPVVSNVAKETKEDKQRRSESQEKAEEIGITVKQAEEPKSEHENQTSKEETIEKLNKFKEDGLITEEEFNRAIAELNKE